MLEFWIWFAQSLPNLGKVNLGWIIIVAMFMGQFWFEIKEG